MNAVKSWKEQWHLLSSNSTGKTAAIIFWLICLATIFIAMFFTISTDPILGILFSLAAGGGLALFAYRKYQDKEKFISELQTNLADLERRSSELEEQQDALFNLTRAIRNAEDEKSFVEKILETSVRLTGADFASFVPIDEHGQPLTVFRYGNLSELVEEAWIEYLASPGIRDQCRVCTNHGTLMHTCPLIDKGNYLIQDLDKPAGIFCLPLRRGDREYGLLNLYFTHDLRLDVSQKENLKALLDASALVLEYFRLHGRETSDKVELKAHQLETALEDVLAALLEMVKGITSADFVVLWSRNSQFAERSARIKGDLPASILDKIDEILKVVTFSSQPYFVDSGTQDQMNGGHHASVIALPIMDSTQVITAVLLVGSVRSNLPKSSRLYLINIGNQIGILMQALESVKDVEVNAIRQERNRLAREIHDGLAQTLAYLKLQMLQMQNMVKAGETERLRDALIRSYRVVSEAFLDVRQAIDDLRLTTEGEGFGDLIKQTLEEFEEINGVEVNLRGSLDEIELPKEFQPQVLRIVQEALSNIRKHARASQVTIDWKKCGEMIQLEIEDNGVGFCLEDIPQTSRYGLRGMQERAALIGADLIVESKINSGTIIRLNVPHTLGNQN